MKNDIKIWNLSDTVRIRAVYDTDYQTRGSYAYDTEEETTAAEDEEIAKLESGEWAVFGLIREEKCPTCGNWEIKDSLCGIVCKSNETEMEKTARDLFDFSVNQ